MTGDEHLRNVASWVDGLAALVGALLTEQSAHDPQPLRRMLEEIRHQQAHNRAEGVNLPHDEGAMAVMEFHLLKALDGMNAQFSGELPRLERRPEPGPEKD